MLQRLTALPREARDTLFLLAVIGWTIAPQVDHLPWWCSALAVALLFWRGWIAVHNLRLPSRWWLVALLALATAATLASHRTILGRDAGVTFIVLLLALKTLEMRAQRDAFVIFFLGFFTLLSNFFYSQSLLIALSMLVSLLGLLTALVNSHMPVGKPPLGQAAKTAAGMALLGAPIMVVLFVFFPRVAPLWGIPSDAMSGRSGLSSSMQVGTVAKLALDSSVAFRVRFDGAIPQQSEMYFRGPVLSRFDGREWGPLRASEGAREPLRADLVGMGDPIRYTVTLEPSQRPWLLVLDAATDAPSPAGLNARMGPELQWVSDRPVTDLLRYKAQSYTRFQHGPLQFQRGLQDYLRLPNGFNPRTAQLAAELRATPGIAAGGASALVNAALARLRTDGYTYTLEPGVYGTHTADEFWFDRKEGFCEHIASSFVLLMRAMDIPARVVTGYQGGEINAVDGYWTVRQSDAHAWTEVWIAGQGWLRVDPTSAVSPGRTGTFERLTAPGNALTQAIFTVSPAFALNLRARWEALNNRWNQWVLNYSQAKQMDLLRNFGFESPSWADLGYVLSGLLVAAALVGAAWTLWERHQQDPWLRLLQRATRRLQAAGLAVPPNTPPRELGTRLARHFPSDPDTQAIANWLLQLEAWRYSPKTQSSLGTLQRGFQQLRWPRAPSPVHRHSP